MTFNFKACRKPAAGNNIITPKCRLSFPVLFTPQYPPNVESGDKFYSVGLLIPPGCDLTLLKEDAARAVDDRWGSKIPGNLKSPFLDAGKYQYKGYDEGWTVIRAKSKYKPSIFNARCDNVTDEAEVYPGRWCVASLLAYAYDVSGNRGVSFGLQNIQLLDHDESLGGRTRAEDEFAPVDIDGGESADALFGDTGSPPAGEAPKSAASLF